MIWKLPIRKVFGRVVKHFKNSLLEPKGNSCCGNISQSCISRSSRSLVQAFTNIATQTNLESEGHQLLANTLMTKICVPMKNLAETQLKARKPVGMGGGGGRSLD